LAARIGAFEASLCYAKITPAALHRGEFAGRCREHVEAVGSKLKFVFEEFPYGTAGASPAVV
jgi:hypothetical protein